MGPIWGRQAVFKISARPRTLTGKTEVGPAGFHSLPYVIFGKIVFQSGKFHILFWRQDRTQVGPMLVPWTLLSGYLNWSIWLWYDIFQGYIILQESKITFNLITESFIKIQLDKNHGFISYQVAIYAMFDVLACWPILDHNHLELLHWPPHAYFTNRDIERKWLELSCYFSSLFYWRQMWLT